jgi:hypothetical protein
MSPQTLIRAGAMLVLAAGFFAPAAIIATPATAADDDIICFDYPLPGGGSDTECGTIGDYKAECELTDPDNTSQFCKDVNASMLFRPTAFLGDQGTPNKTQKIQVGNTRR